MFLSLAVLPVKHPSLLDQSWVKHGKNMYTVLYKAEDSSIIRL